MGYSFCQYERVIDEKQDNQHPWTTGMKTGQNKVVLLVSNTVKPVCNDHLYNEIYYLWFIQLCDLMMTEGTNLLGLTISAFWSSSRWPLAT